MPLSERLQVLVTPAQRARLERLAAQRGISVGAVVRQAIARDASEPDEEVLDELFGLELPVDDWASVKQEIIDAATG